MVDGYPWRHELFLASRLASPWIVGASFIWVIGIMLMVLAVVRLIQVFTVPSSRGWNLVTAILYGIAGWFLFRDPNISLAITTLIIGWGLVIAAVFQGAIWLQTRSLPASGWQAVQRDHHADPGPHGHLRLA